MTLRKPFVYTQTVVRVRPNNRVRPRKWSFASAQIQQLKKSRGKEGGTLGAHWGHTLVGGVPPINNLVNRQLRQKGARGHTFLFFLSIYEHMMIKNQSLLVLRNPKTAVFFLFPQVFSWKMCWFQILFVFLQLHCGYTEL